MPAQDLLHGAAKQHHGIGRLQARQHAERDLDLARAVLDFEGAQRQAERRELGAQQFHHRLDHVVARFGEVLVAVGEDRHLGRFTGLAGVRGMGFRVHGAKDMEFDLQPGDVLVAGGLQSAQRGARDAARIEWHRLAVGEPGLALHPAGGLRPGQHAKARRIGHHDRIRPALHLVHAEAATGREHREDRLVRGVLGEQRGGDGDAVFKCGLEFGDGHRLAAQDAVLVGEGEAHDFQIAFLRLLVQAACGFGLRRVVKAVPFDKAHAARRFEDFTGGGDHGQAARRFASVSCQ